MQSIPTTDWIRLKNMTEDEIMANALKDPDSSPAREYKRVFLENADGTFPLERFAKAMARSKSQLAESVHMA